MSSERKRHVIWKRKTRERSSERHVVWQRNQFQEKRASLQRASSQRATLPKRLWATCVPDQALSRGTNSNWQIWSNLNLLFVRPRNFSFPFRWILEGGRGHILCGNYVWFVCVCVCARVCVCVRVCVRTLICVDACVARVLGLGFRARLFVWMRV